MQIIYAARSNIGKIRKENQDNLFVNGVIMGEEVGDREFSIDGGANFPAVFGVFDGLGGEENGKIASITAASEMINYSKIITESQDSNMYSNIQKYVDVVYEKINSNPINFKKRSATTFALAVIKKSNSTCYNIGDSRIYCFKKGVLNQVTRDHTFYSEKLNDSIYSEISFRDKHKLTRCIGIGENKQVETYKEITGKHRLLITTDGLSNMVDDKDIEYILKTNESPSKACDELIYLALKNGGKDNVSLIVIDIKQNTLFDSIFNKLGKFK